MLHRFWLDSGLPQSRMKYDLCTERNKSLQPLPRSGFTGAGVLVRAAGSPLSAAQYSQLARPGTPHPCVGAKPFRGTRSPWKAGGLACAYRSPGAKNDSLRHRTPCRKRGTRYYPPQAHSAAGQVLPSREKHVHLFLSPLSGPPKISVLLGTCELEIHISVTG